MSDVTAPCPGWSFHEDDMDEAANEARIALNEFAWVNHQVSQQHHTVEVLRDKLYAAETLLMALEGDADERRADLIERGLIGDEDAL